MLCEPLAKQTLMQEVKFAAAGMDPPFELIEYCQQIQSIVPTQQPSHEVSSDVKFSEVDLESNDEDCMESDCGSDDDEEEEDVTLAQRTVNQSASNRPQRHASHRRKRVLEDLDTDEETTDDDMPASTIPMNKTENSGGAGKRRNTEPLADKTNKMVCSHLFPHVAVWYLLRVSTPV